MHVPLIEIVDVADESLRMALDAIATFDWLVVTSAAGAERVAARAAVSPGTKLAAVGTATARTLALGAGRRVDLVPSEQRAQYLADALNDAAGPTRCRILVVQGARADTTLADALRAAGHDVEAVVGYDTVLRTPDPTDLDGADALLLASGSAARAWYDAVGVDCPPIVVAIGPTTAGIAEELGLKVTATATDHSLDGLVTALERILVESLGRRPVETSEDLQESGSDGKLN